MLRRAIADNQDVATWTSSTYRKDGTTFWNALYLSPVRSKTGEVVYFFGSQLNISDKKRASSSWATRASGWRRPSRPGTADLTHTLQQKTALLEWRASCR